MTVKELLQSGIIQLDGGMGTQLQEKGLPVGVIPETLNITKPEWIIDIHSRYIAQGSIIIYTNTFGANRKKLAGSPYSVGELVRAALSNAREAVRSSGQEVLVALDMGPIGELLEPTGALTFEEAYDIFSEIAEAGRDADLVIIETMTDLYEAKAAVLAVKEHTDLPVFVTMSFEANHRTFTGCSIPAMCLTLGGLGVDAIGINCSLGPRELLPIVKELTKWTDLPIIAKPNAGLPDPETGGYDIDADQFAAYCAEMLACGVRCIGGCCGTTPAYIGKLHSVISGMPLEARPAAHRQSRQIPLAVCTPLRTVVIDEPRITGERINPTGKKRFKEALLTGDMDYVLSQAIDQVEAGADILDVNVGVPGIDEKAVMVKTIKALQAVTDVPLQIDSTKPEVLEAALRVYNGKPIINSVNGEEKVMDAILPLAARYGAALVCLTLDENGIPKTADGRFAIARRIMDRALAAGIKKENLIIDALTLTVSAEPLGAVETLAAVRRVKEELGLATTLGVSNISFGLPAREIVNRTFLTMALSAGLDLAIINPNVPSMVWAVKAFKALTAQDENSLDFISYAQTHPAESAPAKASTAPSTVQAPSLRDAAGLFDDPDAEAVYRAMQTGMKAEGRRATAALLTRLPAMDIINDTLIPALDAIGDRFEKGKLFLPQLILAADVARECFEEIKTHLAGTDQSAAGKDKIIIATVKGDIHDIGKNIVKVILENYGYQVLDLGRDVDPMLIVNTAREEQVRLVGLSALMTTTLGAMEETIRLLREHEVDCKVMVGGAVLTADYAARIGADYYARDAKAAADIAREVLG